MGIPKRDLLGMTAAVLLIIVIEVSYGQKWLSTHQNILKGSTG